jgi:hypothetical protein
MIEISAGAVILAAVGGGILVALGLETNRAKKQWIDNVLKDIEHKINEIEIGQLTRAEEAELLKSQMGDIISTSAIWEKLVYQGKNVPMSDLVKFKIKGNDTTRDITWYMNIKTNEFLVDQFRIGNAKDKQVAFKYRLQLKDLGNEAYVMWKMGQGL